MIRVYDTNALWRHDEILRIRHLEAEIAALQKEIDRRKQKAVAAMERLERTKKWLCIIDRAAESKTTLASDMAAANRQSTTDLDDMEKRRWRRI